MVAHSYDPNTSTDEAGWPGIQGQPQLHNETLSQKNKRTNEIHKLETMVVVIFKYYMPCIIKLYFFITSNTLHLFTPVTSQNTQFIAL